jgi:tetratricopeptide (TPR) repeat protein
MGFPRSIVATAALGACAALAACVPSGSADEEYRKAQAAFREHSWAAAAESSRRATEIDARHVDAWFLLGRAKARQSAWDEAVVAYERVLALEPQNAKALHNLANIHVRLGRFDDAERAYARALDIDSDYLLALFHHGWVLRQLNRNEEAERAFRRCLDVRPSDPSTAQTRGDCLFYIGTMRFRAEDYAQAATIFEQVVALVPTHIEARHQLGLAYRHLNRMADAERELAVHKDLLRARRSEPMQMGGDEP